MTANEDDRERMRHDDLSDVSRERSACLEWDERRSAILATYHHDACQQKDDADDFSQVERTPNDPEYAEVIEEHGCDELPCDDERDRCSASNARDQVDG
jgi:hypothetical protein